MTYQPKSYRKFLATSVAAAMVATVAAPMVLANFDDVAEGSYYSDAVDYLVEKEVLEGYPDGSFQPSAGVTRAEAAKILVETLGLEVETEVELGFTDTKDDAWYSGSVAALVKADIVGGFPDGTFAPSKTITRAELAKMVVEANKLVQDPNVEIPFIDTVTGAWYEDSVNTLYSLGIVNGMTDTAFAPNSTVTRAQAAVFVHRTEVEAVRLEVEKIVVDLMVESVSANNLIQAEVAFNTAVDQTTAEDAGNYSLSTGTVVDAELLADGKTVRLTLDADVAQQTKLDITVEDVKDTNGTVIADTTVENVEFIDTAIPGVVSAEVVGNDTVKVLFSEPMDASTVVKGNFEVNGGELYIKSVTPGANGYEVNVELYSTLESGDVSVTVDSAVEDYAGFGVVGATVSATVVEDAEAPTVVGFKSVTPNSATLVFNEDIEEYDGTLTNYYHTNSNNPADSISIDGNELTLEFTTNPLPEGTGYVYVLKDSVNDLWDNKNTQQMVSVDVVLDLTAPVVEDIEVVTESQVVVTFSENVAAVAKTDFTVLQDGEEVKVVSSVSVSGDEVTVNFTENLVGDYSLVIKDIEDAVGNEIADVVVPFTVDDLTDPLYTSFSATLYNAGATGQLVRVNFGEVMATEGKYSVLDKEKYMIDSNVLADITGATITLVNGGKSVEISVPNNANDGVDLTSGATKVELARVADAAGNYTAGLTGTFDLDASATVAYEAKLVSDTKVEVTFEDALAAFDADEFTLYSDADTGGTYTAGEELEVARVSSSVNADGNTVVTFTLATAVNANATDANGALGIKAVASNSVNGYGEIVESTDEVVLDGVKPSVVDDGVAQTATDEYTVTFSEAIYTNSAALAATDFIVVDADGTLVADTDYTVAVTGIDVVITLTAGTNYEGTLTISTIDAPKYIFDNASAGTQAAFESGDNKISPLTAETITSEIVTP